MGLTEFFDWAGVIRRAQEMKIREDLIFSVGESNGNYILEV